MAVPGIPLDEIFASANSLRSAGLIVDYALGGALAAIRYTEPFTTYDADIFFIPTAGIPAIYAQLQSRGHSIEHEHVLVRGFPVQWLAADALTEEAIRDAEPIMFNGVTGRTFRVEHLIAIAASVGRQEDLARIEQFLQQCEFDRARLDGILLRHRLKLPFHDPCNAQNSCPPSLRGEAAASSGVDRVFARLQGGEITRARFV